MLQMSAYQIFHSGYMFHSPADNAGLQPGGDGGTRIGNRCGCSLEMLNLTPKGDHSVVVWLDC